MDRNFRNRPLPFYTLHAIEGQILSKEITYQLGYSPNIAKPVFHGIDILNIFALAPRSSAVAIVRRPTRHIALRELGGVG